MRLLTRSDFDGLACAVLLKELGLIDSYKFVHPKDVQDGIVDVTKDDILANVPYAPGCGMWFDHHVSEDERHDHNDFKGASWHADSAARVICDYYGGEEKFPRLTQMLAAVDKADSGRFAAGEILDPKGWDLLSFVMDPRTGLGRYKDYRISNYDLMMKMIDLCREKTVDEMLEDPDVKERIKRYFEQEKQFEGMIKAHTKVDGNVIITDLRGKQEIFTGNRFVIYALYPEQNISIWIVDGKQKNAVFAVGHSILNKTSNTNVGSLMLKYGGGGHHRVGTCQVPHIKAGRVLSELVAKMKKDG